MENHEKTIKSYVKTAMRYAELYNYYCTHFYDNVDKQKRGKLFYQDKINNVLLGVADFGVAQQKMFGVEVQAVYDNFIKEQRIKMRTLQLSYAKFCGEQAKSAQTVLDFYKKFNFEKAKEHKLQKI